MAVTIAAALTLLLLAPACVISAGLHVVPTPNAKPDTKSTYGNELTAVAAVSPTDVWAAGITTAFTPDFRSLALMMHWDGRNWRIVPTPAKLGKWVEVWDLAAVATNDVWAVGQLAPDPSSPLSSVEPLLLHFDGRRWVHVPVPLPSATLSGVAAVSARDVWAVGSRETLGPASPVALHFNGTAWREVACPAFADVTLSKVAASRTGAVYAIGATSDFKPVVGRWGGHAWTRLPSSGFQSDAELKDVAVAGGDVWVVGDRGGYRINPIEALAWRYTAKGWVSYRPDSHLGSTFNGVHATSAREVWAAGTPGNDGTGDGVVLSRWNGKGWRVAFRIPTVSGLLMDVTTAGGHVFAVGGLEQTLAVQN